MALAGVLGFTLWAFTEAAQQALTLFAFDRWRDAWLAGDPLAREHMGAGAFVYDGVWDAMYFLLLVGFAAGNGALGVALVQHRGFTRLTGAFFLAAFALTLTNIAGELRWFVTPAPLASWLYPAVQPLGRAVIGVWLWRAAVEGGPLPAKARR